MSEWPELLRPFWLLALPPLAGCLWLLRREAHRESPWQRLLPQVFQPWLLSRFSLQRSPWPLRLLGLGWLLGVLALAGPAWLQSQDSSPRPPPLVVMVAMTPDLLASDLPPSRLQHVVHKLDDLLAQRQQSSTAIILYAGSAHILLPLSSDLQTGRNLLGALHPDLMPRAGQQADLAVAEALKLLERSGEGRGQLLLLTNELTQAEQDRIRSLLRRSRLPLDILGIGSGAGAPIPGEQGLLRLADGSIRISRLNRAQLQGFARSLNGRYATLTSDNSDLQLLASPRGAQDSQTGEAPPRLGDTGHWLLLPLLVLAAFGARRGWLFAAAGLMLLPPPAQALEWDDLWLRPDQQAWQLLQNQQPQAAAEQFQDLQWQGIAWYQAGEYRRAAEIFAQGPLPIDRYNLGNALAMQGELEAAIEAWNSALQDAPHLAQARYNIEQTRNLLAQRQQEQAQPEPEGADGQRGNSGHPASAGRPGPDKPDASQGAATSGGNGSLAMGLPSSDAPAAARAQDGALSEVDLQQWLRQIPDNPAELLRRKFWNELQQQENQP